MSSHGGCKLRGPKKHMERVDVIESLLPPKPDGVDTRGDPPRYQSWGYRHCEELIDICRRVCHPPSEQKLELKILKLKHELYDCNRKHARLKYSNTVLRQKIAQLDSTYDDHRVKETA